MSEMFDINLLSQIQGVDKKFSISKEQPRLKRKGMDDNKQKNRHFNDRKIVSNIDHNKDDSLFEKDEEDNGINIDITV